MAEPDAVPVKVLLQVGATEAGELIVNRPVDVIFTYGLCVAAILATFQAAQQQEADASSGSSRILPVRMPLGSILKRMQGGS